MWLANVAVDLVFLLIAFGSLAFLDGQVVGKTWATPAALPIVLGLRRVLLAEAARTPASAGS